MPSFDNAYVNALQSFYNEVGEKYDIHTHSFHSDTASNLVKALGSSIQDGSWVLDLATGTGNVAFALAPKVTNQGRILGIDISDKFLEIASSGAKKLNIQEYVQFSHQDVTDLKLPEEYPKRCFDAVTCGSAIALFPDQAAVVRVAAMEILKPGGFFAVDMHGTHIPVKIFLGVAVPRGFKPPFDPAWIDKTQDCLVRIFDNSPFEIRSATSRPVAAGTMKWDVSTTEATEKLWKSIIVDSPWASFGIDTVSQETLADIKRAWEKELGQYKNADGLIVGDMTQYIVVAVLKPE